MSRHSKYSDEPSLSGVYFQSITRTNDGHENITNLKFSPEALGPRKNGGMTAPGIRALCGGAVAAMARDTQKSKGEIMVYALLSDKSTVRLTELENVVVDEVRALGGHARRAPALEAPRHNKRDESSSSESENEYDRRPRYIEAPRRDRERSESPVRKQRDDGRRQRDESPVREHRMDRRRQRDESPVREHRTDRRRQRSESPHEEEFEFDRRASKRVRFSDKHLSSRGPHVEEPEDSAPTRRRDESKYALIPTGSHSYELEYRR